MSEELKKLQKNEALNRLRILQMKYGLPEYVVREFSENGTTFYSEYECYKGTWTIHKTNKDNYFETAIKEYEINNEVLVYYSIFEPPTHNGLTLSMLYVSEDKCNWETETNELLEGYPLSYEKNFNYDDKSGYWHYPIKIVFFK